MSTSVGPLGEEREVAIAVDGLALDGILALPPGAEGIVLFAHGSGSGRHSPRNQYVANVLRNAGIATLLFDLLTRQEEAMERLTGHLRFDIGLLAKRLTAATAWLETQPETRDLAVGYFGASTGAGAALVAAAERPDVVRAVVARGGRPDLAREALTRVKAPTLLIVGGADGPVIALNEAAMRHMNAKVELAIIPGATHLFEEPDALVQVASLAAQFFTRHLKTSAVSGQKK